MSVDLQAVSQQIQALC